MTTARWATYAIGLGLALRIAVACWNGLAGPSFGADADAIHYHKFAVAIARGETWPAVVPPGFLFARALGLVYRVTGESLLVGSLISCGVWLASAVVLLASMRLLAAAATHQVAGLAVYSVLPSSVVWTSVTMREPYQLLCVNLILFAALKILVGRSRAYWFILLPLVGLAALLHAGMFVVGALVVAGVLCVEIWRAPLRPAVRNGMVAGAAAALALIGFAIFTRVSHYDLSGGPTAAMARLAEGGLWFPARTAYRDAVAVNPFLFAPVWLFQYLFEPMPWRMSAPIDLVFAGENLLRATLIAMMIMAVWRVRGRGRTHVLLAFLSYLSLEALWSLGTFNWGTAARHHIPATGLLLAGALAYSGKARS